MVKVKKSRELKKLKITSKTKFTKRVSSGGTVGRPLDVVIEAVKILNSGKNVTRPDLIRYVSRQYGVENEEISKQLEAALYVACQSGLIVKKGSNFSLSQNKKRNKKVKFGAVEKFNRVKKYLRPVNKKCTLRGVLP